MGQKQNYDPKFPVSGINGSENKNAIQNFQYQERMDQKSKMRSGISSIRDKWIRKQKCDPLFPVSGVNGSEIENVIQSFQYQEQMDQKPKMRSGISNKR
ncbi:MAG: hypothetical protein LPK26_19200 [Bacillaceae bacterium]|nr:hypothetical protein [Bacillaceae bacterium]